MRDYDNNLFSEIMEQVEYKKEVIIYSKTLSEDMISLQYFLTKKYYYSVIVDDYPFKIFDKNSLLEALYYQARLITVHDLNWDSMQEGLSDALNNFLEFEGICLLFKQGTQLSATLQNEFKILSEIIEEINKQDERKKITIILS
jgi:hypothetical protein